jgi:hypothetical protein
MTQPSGKFDINTFAYKVMDEDDEEEIEIQQKTPTSPITQKLLSLPTLLLF